VGTFWVSASASASTLASAARVLLVCALQMSLLDAWARYISMGGTFSGLEMPNIDHPELRPDSIYTVRSRDKTLRIFDVDAGTCVRVLEGHMGSVHACAWSLGASMGNLIVSGAGDKTLRVWDSQTGTCQQVLHGHTEAVMCAAWSESDDGCRWVLSGSDDATVRLWDTKAGTCERVLEGHSEPVLCCAFSQV